MDSSGLADGAIGTTFETDRFTVDEEHVRAFEHGSYLTETYGSEMESAGYPDGLIEGFHLLSMIDPVNHGQLKRLLGTDGVGWNYGLDRVRFLAPAVIGVPYRCRTRIENAEKRESGIRVRLTVEVLDDDDSLVMVADWLTLKRPLPEA